MGKNGYCLPQSLSSMADLKERLESDETLKASVSSKLRVGVHWSTQVTTSCQRVCQVFCSALPLAYAKEIPTADWEPFARVILEAAYDATLTAASALAARRKSRVTAFLTIIGGGAFENPLPW